MLRTTKGGSGSCCAVLTCLPASSSWGTWSPGGSPHGESSAVCIRKYLQLCSPLLWLRNGPGGDKWDEQSCITSGGLPAPFQTISDVCVGVEEIRDYSQTSQLPRFWKTFPQVSLVAEGSLSKHPTFLVTWSASSAAVILFPPWRLICREQKGSLLCLPAARDGPADQGRSMGSGTWQWPCLGTLGGEGEHSMWSWRQSQGTKGCWKMSSVAGWLGMVADLQGSPPASKKSSRGAGLRGKGSAPIKLTVLLMSLWTQPLSFSLPAAT